MKIAVAMTGQGPAARVDTRFGRAKCFAFVDSETSTVEWAPGSGAQASGGAGVGTAQSLIKQGAEAVVAGNFGPNATSVLTAAGVRLYSCAGMTLADALQAVILGQAPEVHEPTVASHWTGNDAPTQSRRGGGRGR